MKLCLNKHSPTCDKPHLISILECINLSNEVTSQEIDVLIGEAVPVAVVISTSRLTGIGRNVRGVESPVEIFLTLSHSQAELAHIGWPVGIRSVGNVVAGGVQVRRPSRRVVSHVVPVAAKALVLVSVNADVSVSIRGRHDWNPILVRLERLLQVHHRRGGQVAPDNLVAPRIKLVSAGGPNLIPPPSWLVEKRDSVQGLPLVL